MQIRIEAIDLKGDQIESASIEVHGRRKILPVDAEVQLGLHWAFIRIGQFVELYPREMVKLNFKLKPEEKAPAPAIKTDEEVMKKKKKEDVKAFV